MRACIVGIQNIKHMTLISMYTQYFEKNHIEYDLIYIDKYGKDEKNSASLVYKFDGTKKVYNLIIGKVIKTIDFKRYTEKILKKNKYDFVVIWREQTAFMFANFLKKYYKNKYSVNIRDLWNISNWVLYNGIKKATENSLFNTISSIGFVEYLPKAEYLMVHSANNELLTLDNLIPGEIGKFPIKITYIGTVRFFKYYCNLIDALGNDSRFELAFIGQGSEELKRYAEKSGIQNVSFTGRFEAQQTIELLQGTHVINCAFGSEEIPEQTLTPIRLYYALYGRVPVLTTEGTWVDSIAKQLGMALTIPKDVGRDNIIADKIYASYCNLDRTQMNQRIELYCRDIDEKHIIFESKLNNYFCIGNGGKEL